LKAYACDNRQLKALASFRIGEILFSEGEYEQSEKKFNTVIQLLKNEKEVRLIVPENLIAKSIIT
ncbi:MAG: hypothetical protein HQK84_04980, partial [Nitrospinae bacterium]|nr:hypothetical protein [Nitrospinota bacterium]